MRRVIAIALLAACSNPPGDAPPDDDDDVTLDAAPPPDGPPLTTPPAPLLDADGFYPRAIQLPDGTILASVVSPQPGGRLGGTILESTDDGVTFTVIGRIDDALADHGLCCATLYELPHPLGALPAGTLLWSASVGGDSPAAPMSIPIWRSLDRGRTWAYLSTAFTAAVPRSQGGLWEPEFSQLDDHTLVCHFSDETDRPAHSQKLAAIRTTDGVTWTDRHDTIALAATTARPGMPAVRRPPGSPYVMTYETCAVDGCSTHLRRSTDGWDWGDPHDAGAAPATLDGAHFRHAPTLAWTAQPGRGRFFLIGQLLHDAAGNITPTSGTVLLANTEDGHAPWYPIPAPVPVPDAYDNFCPNYSSALLPLDGGAAVLELASRWVDDRCRTYFARGPLLGADATGVVDGATYRLVNLLSGMCLDAGGDVQQQPCDDGPAQAWTVDGERLRNPSSGLCLGVTDTGDVVQADCTTDAARWRIRNVGIDHQRLEHAAGGCLDVAGGSTAAGGNIQRWECNDLSPQIWKFTP